MDFSGPISCTRDGAFRLAWRRTGDASLELADAASLRMAPDYFLAGFRIAGSLPNSVRKLGWPRPALQYAPANARAHGRALGENDTRGERKVPPELARTLRQFRGASRRFQEVGLMAESLDYLDGMSVLWLATQSQASLRFIQVSVKRERMT